MKIQVAQQDVRMAELEKKAIQEATRPSAAPAPATWQESSSSNSSDVDSYSTEGKSRSSRSHVTRGSRQHEMQEHRRGSTTPRLNESCQPKQPDGVKEALLYRIKYFQVATDARFDERALIVGISGARRHTHAATFFRSEELEEQVLLMVDNLIMSCLRIYFHGGTFTVRALRKKGSPKPIEHRHRAESSLWPNASPAPAATLVDQVPPWVKPASLTRSIRYRRDPPQGEPAALKRRLVTIASIHVGEMPERCRLIPRGPNRTTTIVDGV